MAAETRRKGRAENDREDGEERGKEKEIIREGGGQGRCAQKLLNLEIKERRRQVLETKSGTREEGLHRQGIVGEAVP